MIHTRNCILCAQVYSHRCVCMYMCMCTYVCMCMWLYVHGCVHVLKCVHACMHVCVCVCVHVHVHVCVHVCVHVRVCMYYQQPQWSQRTHTDKPKSKAYITTIFMYTPTKLNRDAYALHRLSSSVQENVNGMGLMPHWRTYHSSWVMVWVYM